MDLFKFMKNWTLPLAMLAGVIGYFVFANFTFLEPTKPFMNGLISFLTPSLIFAQLLLTFCKIEPKELVPRVWHGVVVGYSSHFLWYYCVVVNILSDG